MTGLMLAYSMLSEVRFTPFLGAVLILWIFSVCVHEFSHALAAYWVGDRTVKERGYLSFNPARYIHPVTSILIPCIFLMMGGIPLPGGAVYIDRSAIRKPIHQAAVSAAGPLSNFLLFVIIAIVIHPGTGLVDPLVSEQPNWVRLLGATACLQLLAMFFNLIPIPPLDGFGMIEPFFDEGTRSRLAQPQFQWVGLIALFFVLSKVDGAMKILMDLVDSVLNRFGLPFELTWAFYNGLFAS
jgi:Zn-dependent protease